MNDKVKKRGGLWNFNVILIFLCLQTNYSYGYGFINFFTEEGAQRALKCLNGVTVRNKRLKVNVLSIFVCKIKPSFQ